MKKKHSLRLFLFAVFLLSFSLLPPSLFADDTYVGILVRPYATRNDAGTAIGTSHSRFLIDFKDFVDELAERDINTVVFEICQKSYHWQCDTNLAALTYPASGGFTASEFTTLAEIVRNANMKIVVCLEILSHLDANAFGEAHPEYMVNEGAWSSGNVVYVNNEDFVENDGNTYHCINSHLSSAANESVTEPGSGTSWTSYWEESPRSIRDPWNEDGEDLMFNMINELVTAFTAYGDKPDAVCIGSDEAWSWLKVDLDDAANTEDLNYAETFAMVMNNAYNYIHDEIDSNIDVMMWADMLDPAINGYRFQTADAVDNITTNIIMVDWRYDLAWYRYDFKAGLYPSVKELTDKGFSVITASWNNTDATKALIWTGNMAEADGDTIRGHFYTTWKSSLIPYITQAFNGNTNVSDLILEIVDAIDASYDIIGSTQCTQNDTSWGTYPNCSNANDSDGFYNGIDYRDYYYDSGLTYNTIELPVNPVSYWDFEDDGGDGYADDRMGNNDGILYGADYVTDSERGAVLSFDGVNDYVRVLDNSSIDMTDALTISCWFKMDTVPDNYKERMVLVGKNYDEYELTIGDVGKTHIFTYASGGYENLSVYSYPWETGRWYHAAYVLDGYKEYFYIDGEMVAEQTKSYEGTEPGTNDLNIGKRSSGGLYFDGRMDDVMVFDEILSPGEVKYLYLTQEMPAPIAYWDFEGNADDRIGSNDGTLAGTAYLDEDIERYNEEVAVLDGDSDYVYCGDPAEFRLTGSRTISAWIKPDQTIADYMVVAGRYFWGYCLSINNGSIRGYVRGSTNSASSWSSSAVVTEDEWQHVAMTFDIDDKIVRLYHNGVDVTESTPNVLVGDVLNPGTAGSLDFSIGACYYLSDHYFSGSIDNVKLFDFALSADQVAVQYQIGGGPSAYSDLFAQNQAEESICVDVAMDEGSGTTVEDSIEEAEGDILGSNYSWVTGISGNALDFYDNSGLDAYVNFGYLSSAEISGSRSISAWIKPNSNPAANSMIACKSIWGYSLYTYNGELRAYVGGTTTSAQSCSSTAVITTGEWQHVMMTFDVNADSKVIRLYRNGIEVASYGTQTALVGSPRDNSSYKFRIGADHYTRYFFDGKIDQVKVFDRALTPRQVMYYYLNSDI